MSVKSEHDFKLTPTRLKVLLSMLESVGYDDTNVSRMHGIKASTYSVVKGTLKERGLVKVELVPSPLFFDRKILVARELRIRPLESDEALTHALLRISAEVKGITTLIASHRKIFSIEQHRNMADAQDSIETYRNNLGDLDAGQINETLFISDLTSRNCIWAEGYKQTALHLTGSNPVHDLQPEQFNFGAEAEDDGERERYKEFLISHIAEPEISDRALAERMKVSRETVSRLRREILQRKVAKTMGFLAPEALGGNTLSVSVYPVTRRLDEGKITRMFRTGALCFAASNGEKVLTLSYHTTIEGAEQKISSVLCDSELRDVLGVDVHNSIYPVSMAPFLMRHLYWRVLETGD
ncbi:MAG: hypothetical protein KIY12_03760 [Thermoplasmata archaeon]|uniref:Uncharacterized protein n=1 Tax=Candidatus Sysuiplasma superficiale TaxID=2823368 RepID=A0A8J7YN32_9ARCH|nr:hypothetical protein [Candidatus Sysuiplasma superficiale]MBX8643824.1 hypothetical protein [Candidatus Sysuiplasma superficiale]